MRFAFHLSMSVAIALLLLTGWPRAATGDIVLYASDVSSVFGAWVRTTSSGSPAGVMLSTPDAGWASSDAPLANPTHYFEVTFDAPANTAYQLWFRLRASGNSKWNDSVWVQFNDAVDGGGAPLWRTGSTSGLLVNLEDCTDCGVSGWGWQDNASWTGQSARVRFATSGSHTLRVQVREDGVQLDQIVLSPVTWWSQAPGAVKNDSTIVPKPSTMSSTVALVRHPYLQQVTSSSAIVVWATRENGIADVSYQGGGGVGVAPAQSRFVSASVTGLGFDYYQHEARLTGLAPQTSYTYTPRLVSVAVSSGDRLLTAPVAGAGTVRFIAFGDSGVGSTEQRQLAARMTSDAFDFAVHTGDVAYSYNAGGPGGYNQLQQYFFDIYRDWLRRSPMYPSIGNHDEEANNAAPFRDLFVLPEHGATSTYPDHARRYYSFDYGPAHVVVLDTELAFQNTSRRQAQLDWLKRDLAATTQPWKMAVFHRSPYSAGGEHGSDLTVRAEFSSIFGRYGVQLVLSGHEHDYERTIPIRETNDAHPVVYVVTGGGGAKLYPAGTAWFTAASRSVFHYVRGSISSCQIGLQAVNLEGSVFDSTTLDRCSTPPPTGTPTPYGGTPAAIPGTIQAEFFDDGGSNVAYVDSSAGNFGNQLRATDVDIEATTDSGGGHNVGWMTAGEWLAYTVEVGASATYRLEARVASSGQGGTFHVEIAGVDVSGPITVPNTGGWQNWTTVVTSGIALNGGRHRMRVVLDTNGPGGGVGNLNYLRFTTGSSTPTGSTPFGSTPIALPGVLQAENFDHGGASVAYRDTTSGNSGGQYRSTDVDIEATTDAGGGYNVGWIAAGEWLAYTVNVGTAGTYTIEARVASNSAGGTFHIESGGADVTGPLTIPNTGGWQNWTSITKSDVPLGAGQQTLRIVFDTNGPDGVFGNVNYLRVSAGTTSTPFGTAPIEVPGVIEAENFDHGGANVAYRDTSAGNSGGQYRSTDVDIEAASDAGGGYNVGWIAAGEWLVYTVNVAAARTYTVEARVASQGAGGTFHVEVGGVDVTGPMTIPNTGGWQNWTSLSKLGIPLGAGRHTIRIVFDANGPGGVVGNVNYLRVTAAP